MNTSALKKSNKKELLTANWEYHQRKMLIVSDLDGTLLNQNGTLDQYTIDVVKKITDKGHIFCLATGRPWRGAEHIYKQLGLKTVIVNLNGSYIWHPYDEYFLPINIVFQKSLVKSLLLEKKIMSRIDNIIVENRSGTYILNKPAIDHEVKEFNEWFHVVMNDDQNIFFGKQQLLKMRYDPNAMLLQIRDQKCIDEVTYYIKETFNTFVVRNWSLPNSGNIIEINSRYANKGNAVDFLSSYYGIQADSTIAFGDGQNDMQMLEKVRFGYAMKNARTSAKLVARYITKHTNDHCGVADTLAKRFFNN